MEKQCIECPHRGREACVIVQIDPATSIKTTYFDGEVHPCHMSVAVEPCVGSEQRQQLQRENFTKFILKLASEVQ
jgi:hypothetical protein